MNTSTTRQAIMGVFLRNKAGEVADDGNDYSMDPDHDFSQIGGKGLLAGLETFTKGSKGSKETKAQETSEKPGKESQHEVLEIDEEEEEEPELDEEADQEEEDEDFPSFGDIVDDEDDEDEDPDENEDDEDQGKLLNEKAYDKQTAEILKALEEKGHPGEVFKKLRAELKKAKTEGSGASAKEVKTLQKQLAELQPFKDEVEGVRERIKQITSKHSKLLVEESEDYQAKVATPMKAMEETIVEMAKAADLDEELLFAAVLERNPVKQDELLEGLVKKLGARQTGRLERFADDIRGINAVKRDMIKNADKVVAAQRKAEEDRIEKEKKERAAEFRSATTQSFEKYAAKIPGFTDAKGRLTEAGKEARKKALSLDPDKLTAGDRAFSIFATNAMSHLVRENKRLAKELSQAKAGGNKGGRMGGKSATKPAAGNGKPGDKPMGLMEHMSKNFPARR